MSRTERGNSEGEAIVLTQSAREAVKHLAELTGASTFKITNQLIVDAAHLRKRVEEGGIVKLIKSNGETYRIEFPILEPEPGPNVIQLRIPQEKL